MLVVMTEPKVRVDDLDAARQNGTVELRHLLADGTTFTAGLGEVRVDGDMEIVFELSPPEAEALGRKLIAEASE